MRMILAVAFLLAAAPAAADSRQHLISMHSARSRAQAIVPQGRIRTGELEREHGRLIYSFDIQIPNRPGVEEVQIDARTGRLMDLRHESPAAERRERHEHR